MEDNFCLIMYVWGVNYNRYKSQCLRIFHNCKVTDYTTASEFNLDTSLREWQFFFMIFSDVKLMEIDLISHTLQTESYKFKLLVDLEKMHAENQPPRQLLPTQTISSVVPELTNIISYSLQTASLPDYLKDSRPLNKHL